ncbi:Maf/Ham1-domain-containing protein [Mycena kentingensis (nom. inval.)]|nr:Maf/Ham1-domain-containing protein [Mycena kentingensis (nom. inval.)]
MPSEHLLPHALKTPTLERLRGKRIVLASASPRRKDILHTFGIAPDIIPSTFAEDLPMESFDDIHEYPVATANHKAVDLYERLVRDDPENAPDLVIAGASPSSLVAASGTYSSTADTVVLSHASPGMSQSLSTQELLEKPTSREDNLRMLLDLNGGVCEIVTGLVLLYPILTAPGYMTRLIDERTLVYFADNSRSLLEAYVESGDGDDAAGGFAAQRLGGILVRKVDGDYHNVAGFPAASFFRLLDLIVEEDPNFLSA